MFKVLDDNTRLLQMTDEALRAQLSTQSEKRSKGKNFL